MAWMRRASLVTALLLAGFAAGCSSSPSEVAPPVPGLEAAGGTTTPAAAPAGTEEAVRDVAAGYQLGPGDQLRVTVFRHEDLSGEFELDGEGVLSMPLIGEMEANTLTARQVEDRIESQLKEQGYLVNPQVSVEVLNYRPFYIIGEVNNPGSYPYVSGMTVINAVALAGGFSYRADQDDITISRGGSNGKELAAMPQSQVLPGDIIRVPERFF